MNFITDKPYVIFEDNTACMELAKEARHREKAKHINMRIHLVRELIDKETISLVKIATSEMVADMLTKSLGYKKFEQHRDAAGLLECGNSGGVKVVPALIGE
jgi:hypothetical protein